MFLVLRPEYVLQASYYVVLIILTFVGYIQAFFFLRTLIVKILQ